MDDGVRATNGPEDDGVRITARLEDDDDEEAPRASKALRSKARWKRSASMRTSLGSDGSANGASAYETNYEEWGGPQGCEQDRAVTLAESEPPDWLREAEVSLAESSPDASKCESLDAAPAGEADGVADDF